MQTTFVHHEYVHVSTWILNWCYSLNVNNCKWSWLIIFYICSYWLFCLKNGMCVSVLWINCQTFSTQGWNWGISSWNWGTSILNIAGKSLSFCIDMNFIEVLCQAKNINPLFLAWCDWEWQLQAAYSSNYMCHPYIVNMSLNITSLPSIYHFVQVGLLTCMIVF
jgi:hypothetical protein